MGQVRDTPRRWQSPNLPAELNLLILRAPGDEASLALASAGFFTLVSRFFWAVLAFPVRVVVLVRHSLAAAMRTWPNHKVAIALAFIFFMCSYGIVNRCSVYLRHPRGARPPDALGHLLDASDAVRV